LKSEGLDGLVRFVCHFWRVDKCDLGGVHFSFSFHFRSVLWFSVFRFLPDFSPALADIDAFFRYSSKKVQHYTANNHRE
jgi:hypothetical protein